MQQLHAFSVEFNTYLEDYIEKKIHSCASLTKDPVFLLALEQTKQLILSSGKRIRPYNVYVGFCVGGDSMNNIRQIDTIKNYLLAIELFHVFCLIHDDIIDNSLLRRGLPTIHALIYKKYLKEGRAGNIHSAANSHAILMGDVVFSWIMELLQPDQISEPQKKAVEYFHTMIHEVHIGQMIDLDITTMEQVTNEKIYEKMKMKTAFYTFVRPLQIGYVLAGGENKKTIDALSMFGNHLGLAFQIQDDMLDIYAKKIESGKVLCKDIQEGQHTLLTQYIYEHGSQEEIVRLKEFFRKEIIDEDISCIQEFFRKTGAYDYTASCLDEEMEKAKTCALAMSVAQEIQNELLLLADFVVKRSN
ncbi:MAG: hypothetical protein CL685_04280 [Candidatus Magasanikbacteria bacterium]|nr:hypothetical protein [Candidatus Magasanikbacteria bacterium]